MPAPRRNWRRESGVRVETNEERRGVGEFMAAAGVGGPNRNRCGYDVGLFVLEKGTLDNFVDQGAQAVAPGTGALEDGFDFGAVRETHGRAGGVDE